MHSEGKDLDVIDLSPDSPSEPYSIPSPPVDTYGLAAVRRHFVSCGPSQCCYHPLGSSDWKCFDMTADITDHSIHPVGRRGGFWLIAGKEEKEVCSLFT